MKKPLIAALMTVAGLLPLSASALTVNYSFVVNAAQEVPTNLSPATGTFNLTVDDTGDLLSFSFAGINFSSPVAAAHIHVAPFGVNGPVVYNLLTNADTQGPGVPLNSFNFAGANKAAGATLADMINANPANYYVNVHTQSFPGGEIRGQVARVSEPGGVGLLALALGAVALVGRRRREG